MKVFKIILLIVSVLFLLGCGSDTKKKVSNDSDGGSDEDSETIDDDAVSGICGNNEIETGETCDGNVANCVEIDSALYTAGKAKCLDDCSGYDTITCEEVFHECGNDTVEGPEVCDGGTKDCVEIDPSSFLGGKAACKKDCSGWDTATCEEGSAVCGDNVVEGAEKCDGTLDLCVEIDPSKYSGGKAYCLEDCMGWDTVTCEEKPTEIIWENGESNTAQFDPRASHCGEYFKGKFYVIGGTGFNGVSENTLADVWTSSNGKVWTLVTDSADFGQRNRHRCIVHDGKLWVIGGRNGSGTEHNDVWFTTDGTTWEADTLPEGGVISGANFAVISNGSDLFVFGAAPFMGSPSAYKRSAAGWTTLTAPSYGKDSSFAYGILNGTMYLAGGIDGSQTVVGNTIRSSVNGESWNESAGAFSARAFASMVNVNNAFYLFGGNTLAIRLGDVWKSVNGLDFEQITTNAGYLPRSSHAVAVSDKMLCIMGGTLTDGNMTSDVWCVGI